MLYEVITLVWSSYNISCHVKDSTSCVSYLPSVLWNLCNCECLVGKYLVSLRCSVITSYSIHYTKLYEGDVVGGPYKATDLGTETATGEVTIPAGAVSPMDAVVCDFENSAAANITINKDSGMYPGQFNFTVSQGAGKIPTYDLNFTTTQSADPMVFNGTSETHKIQANGIV